MIQYSADGNVALYCGYTFRRDPKTGYYLCTKNTDVQKRERLHVFVWRKANGDVAEGYHIHHVDGDKRNNEIENLVCISKESHASHHGKIYAENNRDAMIKNLKENAIPAAAKWHGSKEGKEWHSKHAKETMANIEWKQYKCQQCGKTYWAMPIGGNHKFCSNACKTRARNISGVDNEERRCEICGQTFLSNKYQKKASCSQECSAILRSNRKRQKRGA